MARGAASAGSSSLAISSTEVNVGWDLGVAEHHAAVVGRCRGDIPHTRRNTACDGVLADNGNLKALEHVGGASKTDAGLGFGDRGLALPHMVQAVDVGVGVWKAMPSANRPTFSGNCCRGGLGMRTKVASSSPQAKPKTLRARCRACTSAPWKLGMRR